MLPDLATVDALPDVEAAGRRHEAAIILTGWGMPSFTKTFATCLLTAAPERTSSAAISVVERHPAMRASTSCSRAVSPPDLGGRSGRFR